MGVELRGRVFGAVGLGGIAKATIALLQPFGMKPTIAFDPFCPAEVAAGLGVKLVSLDELCAQADFVSIHCPLNETTRGLIGKAQFDQMKQGSYLINTARGGIVDEPVMITLFIKSHLVSPFFCSETLLDRAIASPLCEGPTSLRSGVVPSDRKVALTLTPNPPRGR
jgi:phosphoglycerate dehydrogenase-like enzyme